MGKSRHSKCRLCRLQGYEFLVAGKQNSENRVSILLLCSYVVLKQCSPSSLIPSFSFSFSLFSLSLLPSFLPSFPLLLWHSPPSAHPTLHWLHWRYCYSSFTLHLKVCTSSKSFLVHMSGFLGCFPSCGLPQRRPMTSCYNCLFSYLSPCNAFVCRVHFVWSSMIFMTSGSWTLLSK